MFRYMGEERRAGQTVPGSLSHNESPSRLRRRQADCCHHELFIAQKCPREIGWVPVLLVRVTCSMTATSEHDLSRNQQCWNRHMNPLDQPALPEGHPAFAQQSPAPQSLYGSSCRIHGTETQLSFWMFLVPCDQPDAAHRSQHNPTVTVQEPICLRQHSRHPPK